MSGPRRDCGAAESAFAISPRGRAKCPAAIHPARRDSTPRAHLPIPVGIGKGDPAMVLRLLFFLLVILGLTTGYQFVEPDIRNYLLEQKMKELVKERGRKRDFELRRDTIAFAREKEIPIKEDQILVTVDENRATIAAMYTDHREFWIFERDYVFTPASSEDARLKPSVKKSKKRR